MKTVITLLLALGICQSAFAQTNTATGLGQGTSWESFTDQIQKDATKKDAFLAGLGGVRHKQVALTAAQMNAMYATPVTLVAAPGLGKTIAVNKVIFNIARTATAFTGGGAAIIQYNTTANGGGTQALDSTLASTVITGAAGASLSTRNGAVISDSTATIVNQPIAISNATAAFATGTGKATVDVWYTVNP